MTASYFTFAYLGMVLPLAALLYGVLPRRARPYVLLAMSYAMAYWISARTLVCLLFSTLVLYGGGRWLAALQSARDAVLAQPGERSKREIRLRYRRRQRVVVLLVVLVHIAMLVLFKYMAFISVNLNHIISALNLPWRPHLPKFVAPLGISFYALQAMAYIFDVYREKIKADTKLSRLALFMGFFPQLIEGPICRYSDTAAQLWDGPGIRYENLISGAQRIAYGLMKKLVIADRLNLPIRYVFDHYGNYDGGIVALAAVFYTCQLYMEFSGTMDVVIGSAEIFGIGMPENFRRPFFSRGISEFWQRWHITLGTWFKDYMFYPFATSGPLKKLTSRARKRLGNHYGPLVASAPALALVWLSNGLWHGAGWHYIAFGLYHFALILTGNIAEPLVRRMHKLTGTSGTGRAYRTMQILRTALLVCIGEVFFRAAGVGTALGMLKRIFTGFTLASFADGTVFTLGMDGLDFALVALALALVIIISVSAERKKPVRAWLSQQKPALRVAIYYAFLLFIVIFGGYGIGYLPITPIYAGF